MFMKLLSFLIVAVLQTAVLGSWMPKEVAEWAIKDFKEKEIERNKITWRGHDRRDSLPFITGDGFRTMCNHICEDANRCRMDPDAVKDGECIFVKTDFFEFFALDVTNRIKANKYVIVSHNGDMSAPDGQSDAPSIRMKKYITTEALQREYEKGRLLDHHGQNLWWFNWTLSTKGPRPPFSHCLPIGLENRQYPIGRQVHAYLTALQRFVVNRTELSIEQQAKKPLMLIAFYPKSRVPDRAKVLSILKVYEKRAPDAPPPFYNYTDLNHMQWLQAITEHRFVLAPFGHGLDTHRISEILLMGGIPVMRRSTISSCYDDSDNNYRGGTRGSLPVVIVDRWEDVTQERLEQEWLRLSQVPPGNWDWSRVFIYHWMDRIKRSMQNA